MITITSKGDFKKVNNFLERSLEIFDSSILHKYGKKGVEALAKYTPKDSGKTAESWYYVINRENKNRVHLEFHNDNVNDYVHIAIILQYGHATKDGHWVEGQDFINPAIGPIFEELSNDLWIEVKRR